MSGHAERRRQRVRTSAGGAVHLRIDHLALHGFPPAQAPRVARALEAELANLAAQPGGRFAPLATDGLPPARIAASPIAEQTGRSVASSLWSGIEQEGKRQ